MLALIELSLNIEFTNWIFADIHKFINKIENILTQLSELEGKYDFSLADKYQGNIFPTQMELAVKMEDLVHQITHEIGSTIAFLKEDIIELHRYIEFRKKYAILSECELLFLIDDIGGNLNIKKCINNKTIASNWLNIRQTVLEDWKSNFGNASFEKINSKLNLLITRT